MQVASPNVRGDRGLFLPSPIRRGRLCTRLRLPASSSASSARSQRECRAEPCRRTQWSTALCLLQPETWQTTGHGSILCLVAIGVLLAGALQTDRFRRAPSLPYFPCSPSVTRSVLFPRPAALGVLLRTSCALRVSASRKSLGTMRWDPPTSRKSTLGLGSGAHSRRFAQECPEANPGKYKQGEIQWHSTKTT